MSSESEQLYRTHSPDEIEAAKALVMLSRSGEDTRSSTPARHTVSFVRTARSEHCSTSSSAHPTPSEHATSSEQSTPSAHTAPSTQLIPSTPSAHSLHSSADDMSTDEQPVIVEEPRKRATRRRRRSTSPPAPEKPPSASSSRKNGPKPRWQVQERKALYEAVIRYKELDNMQSYDWEEISRVAFNGRRVAKACKDQWRREILPKFTAE